MIKSDIFFNSSILDSDGSSITLQFILFFSKSSFIFFTYLSSLHHPNIIGVKRALPSIGLELYTNTPTFFIYIAYYNYTANLNSCFQH